MEIIHNGLDSSDGNALIGDRQNLIGILCPLGFLQHHRKAALLGLLLYILRRVITVLGGSRPPGIDCCSGHGAHNQGRRQKKQQLLFSGNASSVFLKFAKFRFFNQICIQIPDSLQHILSSHTQIPSFFKYAASLLLVRDSRIRTALWLSS